jgi:cell division protease FtsH
MSLKPFRRSRMPQRGPSALALVFLLAALGSFLWWYNVTQSEPEQIIYSQFLDYVEKGNVVNVIVENGVHAQGRLVDGRIFEVGLAPHQDIWKLLRSHNVAVDVRYPDAQPWGSLFFLFLFGSFAVFAFLYFRNMQGGGGNSKIFSMGKSKAKFISPHALGVTFKDVAGAHEAKEELRDVVEFLRTPDKFSRLGAKIPRGVLLCGAPGNGKTMLAKAVAGEAHCPFFSISGSDFVEVFVGVGASRVRDLFAQARKNAPCIVFIDEIDAVGRQRGAGIGGGNDEREQTLNQLLAEMDGFATQARGTVIVLAATNRPDVLDKALLRPGRFDRSIEVPYPDVRSREQILNVHIKNVPLSPEVNIEKIARGTPGFSGADLENLINEAALMASKQNKKAVEMHDFEQARDRVMLGSERKTMIFTDEDKKLTAYHEGGHTLLNVLLPATDPFHKVTIVPRGRALGVSWSLPEGDKISASKTSMLARIQVCLGGLLAEKLFFNEQTTGAASDIAKATEIARDMVCVYGMSSLGPISFQSAPTHAYLGVRSSEREYSAETAKRIDEEVSKIMMECYASAEGLLQEYKDKLQLLAETLIEKETMHAAEVYELLGLQPRDTVRFDQPVEM